jgi:oligopeptide/dipeptide ABC transporter ATP-binding protein
MRASTAVLSVRDLTKHYGKKTQEDQVRPGFRDVSFDLAPGETVAVVGESGCGKTTLARCLTRLLDPDAGSMYVHGTDWRKLRGESLRRMRRQVQLVFQSPETSLNPRMTVAQFIAEVFRNFPEVRPADPRARLIELAELVELSERHLDRYPHELSGGEKQRAGLMRAFACEPSIVVLDEPTSALDVAVQSQVLRTLHTIQSRTAAAYVFISHDVSVVRAMSDRVLVMYLGHVVEQGPTESVLGNPQHPYTRALLAAVPRLRAEPLAYPPLRGEVGIAAVRASECPLRPRCPAAIEACTTMPLAVSLANGHQVACWLPTRTPQPVPQGDYARASCA